VAALALKNEVVGFSCAALEGRRPAQWPLILRGPHVPIAVNLDGAVMARAPQDDGLKHIQSGLEVIIA